MQHCMDAGARQLCTGLKGKNCIVFSYDIYCEITHAAIHEIFHCCRFILEDWDCD